MGRRKGSRNKNGTKASHAAAALAKARAASVLPIPKRGAKPKSDLRREMEAKGTWVNFTGEEWGKINRMFSKQCSEESGVAARSKDLFPSGPTAEGKEMTEETDDFFDAEMDDNFGPDDHELEAELMGLLAEAESNNRGDTNGLGQTSTKGVSGTASAKSPLQAPAIHSQAPPPTPTSAPTGNPTQPPNTNNRENVQQQEPHSSTRSIVRSADISPGYKAAMMFQEKLRKARMNEGDPFHTYKIQTLRDLDFPPADPTVKFKPANGLVDNTHQVIKSLSPNGFYLKHSKLWDPRVFGIKQPCIKCKRTGPVKGFVSPSNPTTRLIYGLGNGRKDGNYYLHTFEVTCDNRDGGCGARFLLTNPDAVALLPPDIQRRFPAFLSAKAGVDADLIKLAEQLVARGVGPTRIAQICLELATEAYDYAKAEYYHACSRALLDMADKRRLDLEEITSNDESTPVIPKFSDFDDAEGYAGRVPSGWFTRTVHCFLYSSL